MGMSFETFGNAIVQFREDRRPVLTTDPWLVGTCYFGSWGFERPPTDEQIRSVQESPFVWISHGHPDHLHHESLKLLDPSRTRILLPDHYEPEIDRAMKGMGFATTILAYRKWYRLGDRIRVMCLDNENQDGILVVEAGDALIVNLNDSPLCGEGAFLRDLIRRHRNDKTYLLGLCSIDADMINIVDESGRSLAGPPEQRKRGAIWGVAVKAAQLGAKHWCCSSSQHKYVRSDSAWANPYRIGWADMQKHWIRPEVRLVQPYVTVDLESGAIADTPWVPSEEPQVAGTGGDDWSATLSAEEWIRVERFVRKFEIIQDRIDFIEFVVGGERRRVPLKGGMPSRQPELRGIVFHVPAQSLMETIEYGYFDDLLIGNFMKTELVNTKLYPHFSKQVAKIGGNAKVFTKQQLRDFQRRYLRRSPAAFLRTRLEEAWYFDVMPSLRAASESLGIKPAMKMLYRRYRKEPVVTDAMPQT